MHAAAGSLAVRAQLMADWLGALSTAGESTRTTCIAAGAGDALGFGGAGVYLVATRHESKDSTTIANVLASLSFGLSAASLYSAIACATARSNEDTRYHRWLSLPQLDEATLAGFEAELATEAALARMLRIFAVGESVGFAAGGGALIALTETGGVSEQTRILSSSLGIAMVGFGLLTTYVYLSETVNERAYRLYRAGVGPHAHASPTLAGGCGELCVSVSF